jgi:large subunit ribosomal protein L29
MGLSKFTDIISLSNTEISEAIIKTENKLFNLRFKKATRQNFKSHEIKQTKRRLAQLKTLLTIRLQESKQKPNDVIDKLIIT